MLGLRRVAGLVAHQRLGDSAAAGATVCKQATQHTLLDGLYGRFRALASGSGDGLDDDKPASGAPAGAPAEEAGATSEPAATEAAASSSSADEDDAAPAATLKSSTSTSAHAAMLAAVESLSSTVASDEQDGGDATDDGDAAAAAPGDAPSTSAAGGDGVDHLTESPIDRAVRHKYGAWGLSSTDLRSYIETTLDIEDALAQGSLPQLDADRYAEYKRIRGVVEDGPEWSEEETEWVNRNIQRDLMQMPWPTNWKRHWLRSIGGVPSKMRKFEQSTYDQGWMSEALVPFASQEDMMAHREGRPSLDEPASHWPDERSADGAITRSDHRTPGSVDMSDWATKLAAAARSHDSAAASRALSKAGSGAGARAASGGQAALEAGSRAGSEAGLEAVTGSSVEGEVADEESLWAGLDDVADGTEPSDEQLGMQPVGAAVYQAALDEQASILLRRYGFEEGQRAAFCERVDLSDEEFDTLVSGELRQQMKLFAEQPRDSRSPEDLSEDMVPLKRRTGFFSKPLYDMRSQLLEQENSPFSDSTLLPEFLQHPEKRVHPAVEQAFLDRLTVNDTADDAVPSVVHWDQTVWLHTGTASYHPGNGRVRLRVKARDLQAHYALSDAALVHVLQVAGQRYNKNTGELKISCDRHRAREDNRRQALHWLIRLVESGHLKHPSPAWESMKQRQTAFMEAVL